MRKLWHPLALALLALATIALIGCSPGDGAEEQQAEVDTEEWTWLQTTHEELQQQRAELRELRKLARGQEPAEGEEIPEELADLSTEELVAKVEEAEEEIYQTADEFGQRLAQFINSQEISIGGELTDVQRQALRMNSAEAMATAEEFIEKGGDYQRAIDIYNQTLVADPDNEDLKAALASAEELRFMTEERFSQVKNKMTESEVRALLGPVNLRNIKDYPERAVKAWFYRKADGGAAAVWFRETKKGSGNWTVYKTNFEEIKQQVIGGEESTEDVG